MSNAAAVSSTPMRMNALYMGLDAVLEEAARQGAMQVPPKY